MNDFDDYRFDHHDFDDHTVSLAIRLFILAVSILILRLLAMNWDFPEQATPDQTCCVKQIGAPPEA